MELYTIRYNLYNYILKNNFDYMNIKDYIFLWKNGLIILFIFLILIFIYKFNDINFIGFIIIFIILLFIYLIYFEIGNFISNIENNKYLIKYGYFYNLSNILFNESFNFINDNNNNNLKKINNIDDLLKNDYLTNNLNNNINRIIDDYLYINIYDKSIDDYNLIKKEINLFLKNNINLIKIYNDINNINIIFDNIEYIDNNSRIDDLFKKNSKSYLYLSNQINSNYYIDNSNYLNILIKNNSINYELEYNYLKKIFRNYKSTNDKNNIIIDDITKKINNNDLKIDNTKDIILKLKYDNLKSKYDNKLNDDYIFYFLQKIINEIDDDNKNYKKLIENGNKSIFLKIKIELINDEDKLKKNIYIKNYIYKLIDKINYNNIYNKNKYIKYAIDNNKNILLEYLLEYQRINEKIKYNMKYEDNKTNEEITDIYYNLIKKNNDLLKYIDINKLNYLKKYIFIKKENIFNNLNEYSNIIDLYKIEENNYYLINIEQINNIEIEFRKELLNYINKKYETNYKNFNILFENLNIKNNKKIKKIIEDYNNKYIIIIIISIIIITIICHIFYTELIRW